MNKYSVIALLLSMLSSSVAYAELNHQPLSGEVYRLIDTAYQAMSKHDDAFAEALVSQARILQPDSYQIAMLLLDLKMRRSEWAEAKNLSDELRATLPKDALLLANSGFIAQQQQRRDDAHSFFKAALIQPGLNEAQQSNVRASLANLDLPGTAMPAKTQVETPLNAAYRYLSAHQDVLALEKFQQGFAQEPGTANQYADAAYAAKRLHQNKVALGLLQQAIDANAALPEGKKSFTHQQLYNYRSEAQMMSREWGAVAVLAYQNNALTSISKLNTLQGSVEAYWQPSDFVGNQDGHYFQVFTGLNETLYDAQGGKIGTATAQATVGARYKPFSQLGLVLVGQQLFALGSAGRNDTLLHLAYSDGVGTSLNVQDNNWRSWQYYVDLAYLLNEKRTLGALQASYGHALYFREHNDRITYTPHWALTVDSDSAATQVVAVGSGPGISMRYWLRENTYCAPASYLDFKLQYRFSLTHSNRARGLLMNAIYSY
jgi:Tfp pilus assembly protein PilF